MTTESAAATELECHTELFWRVPVTAFTLRVCSDLQSIAMVSPATRQATDG
jgi:hypothetical protein